MRHTIVIWLMGAVLVLVGCGQQAAIAPTIGPTAPSVPSVTPTSLPPPATFAPLPTTAVPLASPTIIAPATVAATVPPADSTSVPSGRVTDTPVGAAPSGRVTDTPVKAASAPPSQSPLISLVLHSLQALPNIGAKTLSVQSFEAKQWSDSSLGCPDPAAMYLAVITPGYKIVVSDGATSYDVHTNNDASTVVWCQAGKPVMVPRVP